MKYKMIACDLDGTLMGTDCHISAENNSAISELNKMGVHFVPCTGRTLSEVKEVYDNPDVRYIIYSTGAGILDKQTGEIIKNGLPDEVKEKILGILSSYDVFPFIHANGNCYTDKRLKGREKEYKLNDTLCDIADTIAIPIDDFERNFMEMEVEYISVFFKNTGDHKAFLGRLLPDERIVTAEPWPLNYEIFYAKAGKDKAIKNLADMLGIDVSEVISIGDSNNDISALKTAGLGIAVSNGSDEIKEIADVIGCSNDGHIAKYVLERYFM